MYKIIKGLIYAKVKNIYIYKMNYNSSMEVECHIVKKNIYIIEEIATRIYMCIPYCIWTTVIKMNTHINGITCWEGPMPWITFPLRQNFREDHLPSKCDIITLLKFGN